MYQFSGFSSKADAALNAAIHLACDLGHTYVGSEHLLAGLLKDTTSGAAVLLASRHITFFVIYEKLKLNIGYGVPTVLTHNDFSPRLTKIVENALSAAKKEGEEADTTHLLASMLKQPKCAATEMLFHMGVRTAPLIAQAERTKYGFHKISDTQKSGKPFGNEKLSGVLEKYATDLTALAAEGKIDPIACREKEISRLICILCRRTKNNPCLLGEPGVGKTAVVEGLATKISSGDVPDCLKNKRLVSVSLNSMVAGAKYRGDFEERIKNMLDEVKKNGDIILFIDEIHNIVGAGSAEGAVDAANILKPELARGEIQLIGATTSEEYRKTVQKDAALDRRFQTLILNQPSEEQALQMLKALKPLYESHHRCRFTDEALGAAVSLSVRYLTQRFLPDKAIDVLDEAAAKANLKYRYQHRTDETDTLTEVGLQEIYDVISEQSQVPVSRLKAGNRSILQNLQNELTKEVIGQEQAINTVMSCINRCVSGITNPERPIGVFLFCGSSGVGKTLLAKAVAKHIFGSTQSLIRFDMGEYTEKQSIARLIGSPPGYVGYEEGGMLVKRLEKQPYSLLLFDEIEKADASLMHLFLQMLEEGTVSGADGRKIGCTNALIVFTSNLGAEYLQSNCITTGFATDNTDVLNRMRAENKIKQFFTPEFLNRIDEIVYFKNPTEHDLAGIAEKELNMLVARTQKLGLHFDFSSDLCGFIASVCKKQPGAARAVRRYIEKKIEVPLSELLTGQPQPLPLFATIKIENNEPVCRQKQVQTV